MIVIKGAGDLASGAAVRLAHCGFQIVMTDLLYPTSIRRTVCFSEAILNGTFTVEDVTAEFAPDLRSISAIHARNHIAVLADPEAECIKALQPEVVIDAILAKKNLGTNITDAPIVIALGPGFTAGADCHAVIETMRGHDLGRVLIPELLQMVDDGRMAMSPAVEISFLKESEQRALLNAMEYCDCTPSHAQSIQLKRLSQVDALDDDLIRSIMGQPKPNQVEQIKLRRDEFSRYFPASYSAAQMKADIQKGLELLKRQRERNKNAR